MTVLNCSRIHRHQSRHPVRYCMFHDFPSIRQWISKCQSSYFFHFKPGHGGSTWQLRPLWRSECRWHISISRLIAPGGHTTLNSCKTDDKSSSGAPLFFVLQLLAEPASQSCSGIKANFWMVDREFTDWNFAPRYTKKDFTSFLCLHERCFFKLTSGSVSHVLSSLKFNDITWNYPCLWASCHDSVVVCFPLCLCLWRSHSTHVKNQKWLFQCSLQCSLKNSICVKVCSFGLCGKCLCVRFYICVCERVCKCIRCFVTCT